MIGIFIYLFILEKQPKNTMFGIVIIFVVVI